MKAVGKLIALAVAAFAGLGSEGVQKADESVKDLLDDWTAEGRLTVTGAELASICDGSNPHVGGV